MLISGILSSAFTQAQPTNTANPAQKFFSQLAAELDAGDSSAAQNDLSARQQAIQGQSSSGSSPVSHAGSMHFPHNNHRSPADRFESVTPNLLDELDPTTQSPTAGNILQASRSSSTPSASGLGTPFGSSFGLSSGLSSSRSSSLVAPGYQVTPSPASAAVSFLA